MNISIGKAIGLAVVAAIVSSALTAAVLKKDAPLVTEAEKPAQVTQAAPTESKVEIAAVPIQVPEINLEQAMLERSIGSADAPITIIEYASMTCDHCAAFHNQALPEVKTQLIETGKARLVYRDMPWDKFALKASKMARCAPPEKYFEVLESIFKTQENWAHSPDPLKGLTDIGLAAGIEEKYLQACFNSDPLETAILEKQQDGRRTFDIKGTPAFIFMKGGNRQENFPEFEEIFKRLGEHKHKD